MNYKYLLALLCLVTLFSCDDDDDPMIINEEELITTLNYILTPADGGDALELSFVDLDGDGDGAPVVSGATLAANTVYTGVITVLNEAETPSEDITVEVQEEAADHQFFFSTDLDLTVTYTDQDANGQPIGLSTSLTTGEAGTGNLTIILKHKPEKSETGVSAGDITNAGGETDIQVALPIIIE